MPKLKNAIRGKRNQQLGKQFEQILVSQARTQGILPLRIPDACRPISATKFIRMKSPFDFVLLHKSISVYLDCKSFDSQSISYSQMNFNQIQNLTDISDQGFLSGYLVWFRPINSVVFFDSEKLRRLQPRTSLLASQGLYLGSIDNFSLGNLFL